MISATTSEIQRRDLVMAAVQAAITSNKRILFGAPEYAGSVGEFQYQFEGEDDLLHLIVERSDGAAITPEEGQLVAGFLMPDVSPGVVWLKPGEFSQHFYLGHDELLNC